VPVVAVVCYCFQLSEIRDLVRSVQSLASICIEVRGFVCWTLLGFFIVFIFTFDWRRLNRRT